MAVVTDLDDTLILSGGRPNPQMLDTLLKAQSSGERIIVVSGRSISRLDETEKWLEDNGLNIAHDDVHLSDFPEGPNASREFKVYKAKQLIDEGIEISVWYENDAETRQALAEVGVNVSAPVGQRSIDDYEIRATAAPAYMRDAAETGLRLFAEGKAGDGVTAQTVREARDMAKGIVSDDKWVRVAAWIARHRIDWEEVPRNNDPSVDGFPGAGAVAAYLWGVDPTLPDSADRVIAFAKQAVGERVKEDDMEEIRGVTGATDLPIGDRGAAWDGVAAEGRVRAWAGGRDNMDWTRYARAFFWVDPTARDQFGGYKLQFADIVDGELTAMPRGVFAVAAILAGSRGGVDLPAQDVAPVKARVAGYYQRMADQFDDPGIVVPFDRSTMPAGLVTRFSQLYGKEV